MKMKILKRVTIVFSHKFLLNKINELFRFFFIATRLKSLYVDEQALTKDQVILPKDFLNFNLQRHIKHQRKWFSF